MYIHYPFNWLTLGTASNSSQSNALMIHTLTPLHTHTHTEAPDTERPCRGNLPLNFCRALSAQSFQLSIQLSVLAQKASCESKFAALSLVGEKYLWHLQWHAGDNPPCDCRTNWGSAALKTGEHGGGHGGNVQSRGGPFGSLPFQPLQPMVHLPFRAPALSFSAHSCRASTGRKLYYGWVNLLINIQPLDPAFPRWPIKNYNWQRAQAWQQVAVGPRAGGCDRRCGSCLGPNKSCGLSLLFDSALQKDKCKP